MLLQYVRKTVLLLIILLLTTSLTITPTLADNQSSQTQIFTPEKLKISPFAFVYGNIADLDNAGDPYYSIQKLQDFPYLVCAEPGELSENSKLVTDTIKENTKLFGYVNLGPNNPEDPLENWRLANLNEVKGYIDNIANSDWYGVFIDQFGYDFQETRQRQNEIVDYAHQKGLKCFVNAWFPDDVMGSDIHPDNNPQGEPTHLQAGDYYLIESFLMSGSFYRGGLSYMDKFLKVKKYQDSLGINAVVLSYKWDDTSWEDSVDDITLSYLLSQCLGYEGWWFGGWNGQADYWHLNPKYDIGKLLKPLHHLSETVYRAETEFYTLEYYADDIPHLIAFPKRNQDSIITIRHPVPDDYLDINLLTVEETLSIQKKLNAYGFTDYHKRRLKEDSIFNDPSRSALNQFLYTNNFVYYSTKAKDTLSGNEAINALAETGELGFKDKTKIFIASKFIELGEIMGNIKEKLHSKTKVLFSQFEL